MQKTSLFNIVKPYLAISTAFTLAVTLAAGPYLIAEIAPHLQTALWFSLIFMILITIIQIARTEKNTRNLSDQLIVSKKRLGNEIKHR